MERKEKPIIPKIKENRLELLLFILSIVQGLAFTRLVELTIEVLKNSSTFLETAIIAMHSFLCFLIIIRLFETILLGFLDYDEAVVSFYEVIMIFIIGAFEYWVIDSISDFTPVKFYFRIIFLAFLSLVGYMAITIKISGKKNRRTIFEDYSSYIRELKLQAVNVSVPFIILIFSILILTRVITSDIAMISVAGILSILIIFNIVVSWVVTVAGPKIIIPWDYDTKAEISEISLSKEHLYKPDTVRTAQISDSLVIAELYLKLFPYVFRNIFETSDRFIIKILARVVSFNNGRSYLGYKKVTLAPDKENDISITGFIVLSEAKGETAGNNAIMGLYAICYVFYFTGFWGVFRVIKNIIRNRKASPNIREDELYISYLGVLPQYRNRGIATDLIRFAEQTAFLKGKKSLGLDVREDNLPAIKLFRTFGFREIYSIDDKAFGKPERIYMSKSLSG